MALLVSGLLLYISHSQASTTEQNAHCKQDMSAKRLGAYRSLGPTVAVITFLCSQDIGCMPPASWSWRHTLTEGLQGEAAAHLYPIFKLRLLAQRRAEACLALLLDSSPSIMGDEHHAVLLLGTFVNQDGRSSSLTAPNGPSQQEVIRGALRAAQQRPQDIAGLEMHGTGTPLGDPIETGALTAVLQGQSPAFPCRVGANQLVRLEDACNAGQKHPLKLSAAKSTRGHAEPAAGGIGINLLATSLLGHEAQAMLHLRQVLVISQEPHEY